MFVIFNSSFSFSSTSTYFQVIVSHKGYLFQELPDKIIKKPKIQKIGNHYIDFKDGTKEYVDVIIYCTG